MGVPPGLGQSRTLLAELRDHVSEPVLLAGGAGGCDRRCSQLRRSRARYTAPETTIPNSQLRSARPTAGGDRVPEAREQPSCTDQPAISPAKKAIRPLQLMSP